MVTSVREYPEVAYDDLSTVYTELVTFLGEPIAKGKVQTSLNGNGTFAIRAFKEGKPDWDNTTPVYNKTNVRNPGVNGQQETFQATGVPVANAPAIVAGAAASSSDYQLDNAQFIERDHGEGVVQATQTKKNESAVIVRNFPARGSQRAIDERIWPLIRQEDFTTIWGEAIGVTETLALGTRVTDAGYPNNILDYAQADLLGNGMWRISSLVVKCPETILIADGTEIACNDDSDVTLYQVQDATDIPTFSSASPTSVRLTSLEKNRYGKYDYVKQTTTSRVPKSCSIAISWTTKGRYYWIVHTYLEGVPLTWWRYYDPTVHTISFHTTGDAAKTALSGGNNGSVPHRVGNNLWMAHKVVWGNPVHE